MDLCLLYIVQVAAVNCEKHRDVCEEMQVTGYPTVYLFPEDKEKPPVVYEGERYTHTHTHAHTERERERERERAPLSTPATHTTPLAAVCVCV